MKAVSALHYLHFHNLRGLYVLENLVMSEFAGLPVDGMYYSDTQLFGQGRSRSRARRGGWLARGDRKRKTKRRLRHLTCTGKCTVDKVTCLMLKADKTHTHAPSIFLR